MPKQRPRVFSREFKLAAMARLEAGETVPAVACELGVSHQVLYGWRARMRAGGAAGLRPLGRPRRDEVAALAACPPVSPERQTLTAAQARIGELERKIGRQQLELDFFKRALRQVEVSRQPNDEPGATASTPSSKR